MCVDEVTLPAEKEDKHVQRNSSAELNQRKKRTYDFSGKGSTRRKTVVSNNIIVRRFSFLE